MKKTALTMLLLLCVLFAHAQDRKIKLKNKKEVFFIEFSNDNTLEFGTLESNRDSRKDLKALSNHINIYSKWLNPIKYKITWTDSLATDGRDEIVQKFTNTLLSNFSLSTSDNEESSNDEKASGGTKNGVNSDMSIQKLTSGDLSLLEFQIFTSMNELVNYEKCSEMFNSLKKYDSDIVKIEEINFEKLFLDLYNAKTSGSAKEIIVRAKNQIEKFQKLSDLIASQEIIFNQDLKNLEEGLDGGLKPLRKSIEKSKSEIDSLKIEKAGINLIDDKELDMLEAKAESEAEVKTVQLLRAKNKENQDKLKDLNDKIIKIEVPLKAVENKFNLNKLFYEYIFSTVKAYVKKASNDHTNVKQTVTYLESILKIMQQSFNNKINTSTDEFNDFYKLRSVAFDDGKTLTTKIIIEKYKYSTDSKTFSKEKNLYSGSIQFEKYDFFNVSVATGGFYANTTLPKYGLDENYNIIEEDLREGNLGAALYLNLNFQVNSRYFVPLIQLGVDPTKEMPFFLLGTGFSIPSSHIAITGGPIWTFTPNLTSYEVGETVESDLALQNDISYEFQAAPKGFYLGLQYNF